MNIAFLFIAVIFLIIFTAVLLKNDFNVQNCSGNFTATLRRIIDGDTLELKECEKHIRLSLANTPEVNQKGWFNATSFTANLCKVGSQVRIQQSSKEPYDVYGRIVALVYCQDKKLNEELILNNLAVIDTRYCSRSEFATESWAWDNGCKNV